MSLPLTAPARLPTDIDEDTTMISRRNLIGGSAILAGAAAVSGRVQAAAIPEAVTTTSPAMQPPLVPSSGPAYQPVVTLNGWTLPWRINGDWKEFHLVAEPVTREIAPGMKAHLWGYNGQSPGPTLELRRRRQGPHLRHQQAARAHNHSLARHAGAERNGWRRRIDTAAHQAGPDLRLRIRAQEERNVHVSPACRRDGADGDGNDGIFRCSPTGSQAASCRPRFRLSHEQLRHRPGQLFAQGHDHDRFQPVDLEQPRVSRH